MKIEILNGTQYIDYLEAYMEESKSFDDYLWNHLVELFRAYDNYLIDRSRYKISFYFKGLSFHVDVCGLDEYGDPSGKGYNMITIVSPESLGVLIFQADLRMRDIAKYYVDNLLIINED